jgi:hypothetical protein
MNGRKFLTYTNKKIMILTIFLGAAFVGFTTGDVIAQQVNLGSTSGSPHISFEDAMSSGMYEIRLNDGTGQFQIYDLTNNKNSMLIDNIGRVAVGDEANPVQQFTIGCQTGKCNIMTRSFDNDALNTVNSLGDGNAIIRLVDTTPNSGTTFFELYTRDDGTACLGNSISGDPVVQCMLIFELKGADAGKVKQNDGTCIANC